MKRILLWLWRRNVVTASVDAASRRVRNGWFYLHSDATSRRVYGFKSRSFIAASLMALLAFASRAADDELWLYWMIDASGETGGEQAERIEFYGANLYVVEESGTGRLVDADFGTGTKIADGPVTVLSAANELYQGMKGCECLISDISGIGVGASFYVELLNANGEAIGRSQEITMDALIAGYDALTGMVSGYQTQDPFQHGHGGQWVANSFYAVPEPSSGLLLLIGTALLALRRRRT